MPSRIIKLAENNNEFITADDGFVYWWPSRESAMSSHHLRALADELDKRNEKMSKIMDDFYDYCISIDPDSMCKSCSCWKQTRVYCG
jgi:hypothetical protein